MGPEEVGSRGARGGGTPGGGPSSSKGLEVKKKKNVEGVQGTVWQETGVDRLAGLVTDPGNRGLTGC